MDGGVQRCVARMRSFRERERDIKFIRARALSVKRLCDPDRTMMAKPNVKRLESRSPLLEDGTSSET